MHHHALCMQDMYQNISKQVSANRGRDLRFVREKNSESFYPLMKSKEIIKSNFEVNLFDLETNLDTVDDI